MNLLFSFADLELWQWIAIAAIIVAAIIIIVLIIVWARKKSAKNGGKSAEKQKKSKNTEEEQPAANAKTVEKSEPVKQETAPKAAEKPAEKPVQKTEEPKPAPAKDNGKVYHISKRKSDGKWQIKLEGGAKAIKLFDTQADAIAYGKTLSENQDARFVLHKLDGSFRKLTY